MRGCPPGQTGDGLIHESGDVALRVTPAGLIVVGEPDRAAAPAAERPERPVAAEHEVVPGERDGRLHRL